MCIQIFEGVHNVVFFFFNEPIKLFHYNMNILSLVYTSFK